MRQARKPTLRQKEELKYYGLNPENWLIERDCNRKFVIVHREVGQRRVYTKGA